MSKVKIENKIETIRQRRIGSCQGEVKRKMGKGVNNLLTLLTLETRKIDAVTVTVSISFIRLIDVIDAKSSGSNDLYYLSHTVEIILHY